MDRGGRQKVGCDGEKQTREALLNVCSLTRSRLINVNRDLAHGIGIANAPTEVFITGVVREAFEPVLDSLGERRFINVGILWLLACEFCVKVCHIQDRFLRQHRDE